MAIYAIGDVQGCFDSLLALLDRIKFRPAHDKLWLVGDLVNRGPNSVETIRYVRMLGDSAITVLGNHDLHLLALHAGIKNGKLNEGLKTVLNAPDAEELLTWLRHRPLFHYDKSLGWAMVHAGLAPQWTIEQSLALAAEVEAVLQSGKHRKFLSEMYGNKPNRWSDKLTGFDRLRVIVNYMTRVRYCSAKGIMDFSDKGPPGTQGKRLFPWYELPKRQHQETRIVFGHWSALGVKQLGNLTALDGGCVWGNQLAAARLDTDTAIITTVDCPKLKS